MSIEKQIRKLADGLKIQINNCPDPAMLDELVARRMQVLQFEQKVTAKNINRATAHYKAFAVGLEAAVDDMKQEIDEIEDIAKWIERAGKVIGKLCELAAKIA